MLQRQAQIRRKTYKSKKKHQDRVQDTKRQEKTQKVKNTAFHRSTMCAIVPRWQLLARQEIRRNKS
jgi:hypothetical protein